MEQRPDFASLIGHIQGQLNLTERYIDQQMAANLELHARVEATRTRVIESTARGRPETQQALLSVLSVMEESLERVDRFYQLEYQRMYADKEVLEALARLAQRLV